MKWTCKLEQLNLHGHSHDIILALAVVCHSALLRKQVLHIAVLTDVSQTPSFLEYLQIYMTKNEKQITYWHECTHRVTDIKTNLQNSVILFLFISLNAALKYTVKLWGIDLFPIILFELLPNTDFTFPPPIIEILGNPELHYN
jgi:hypothetical protein